MAIQFNGINQGLNISTTSLAQNVSQCTLMAWVNIIALPSVSGGLVQINTNGSTTASRINLLLLNNGAIRIGGRAPDSQATISSVDSTTTITTGTWYHVVGMIDFTNDLGYIYINGIQSTTTGTLAFTATTTDNTTSYASNLGSDENNTAEWCNVIIDDARVYHRLLNDNEIQTIFACRGTDVIDYGLQARWLPIGPDQENIGIYTTITTSTPRTASATNNGTTLSVSYTAPTGSNLVLCVAGAGQSTNTGRVLPTNITFNSVALTTRTQVRNTTSTYSGVGLWSRSITSGESGTITITWGGTNNRRTLAAYTLIGAQDVVEASSTAFNNSGVTTTGLTTITDGAIVVTAGSIGNNYTMSAIGTNHNIDTQIAATSLACVIGDVATTIAGGITGIGFSTSPAPNNMEVVLAAFTPAFTAGTITELSDNKYLATALNIPIFVSSILKYRRPNVSGY